MPELLQQTTTRPELSRDLGVSHASAVVVGTIIGSGIFLVPAEMMQAVGSAKLVYLAWLVGGLLSFFGALTYAELGAMKPQTGGEYVYVRDAYGPLGGFLYGWTWFVIAKPASVATVATGLVRILGTFSIFSFFSGNIFPANISFHSFPVTWGQLVAIAAAILISVLNYLGVKKAGEFQLVFTVLKVAIILGIVAVCFSGAGGATGRGWSNFAGTFTGAKGGIAGFMAALVAALWAYDGWNNVSMVSSEVRDPQRNLPLALIGGTTAVIAIYLLTNAAYFHVLSATEVGSSTRVAAEMMRRVMGSPGAGAVSLAAMISIFAALNGSILTGARVPYAAARQGYFFAPIARINAKYRTPGVSIWALSIWAALLVLSGRFEQLFTYVIFSSWILYAMTAAAVLVLRRKQPGLPRPYRTLGYPWVPIVFVLVAFTLIVSTLLDSPRESLMGIGLILLGVPFYFYWKKRRSNDSKLHKY